MTGATSMTGASGMTGATGMTGLAADIAVTIAERRETH